MPRKANPAPAPDQTGALASVEEEFDPDVAEMEAVRRRAPDPKAAQRFIESAIAMGEKLTEDDWVVCGRRVDRDRDRPPEIDEPTMTGPRLAKILQEARAMLTAEDIALLGRNESENVKRR